MLKINPVDLGTAAGNYAILAKTGVTCVPSSTINGNIGVSPIASTAITGFALIMDITNEFSTSPQIFGKVYAANYSSPTPNILTIAMNDMEIAYVDAAGRIPNYTELYSGDLGGHTYTPGVYSWSGAAIISSNMILEGGPDDVWIFQLATGITQQTNSKMILTGGAQTKNVFWQSAGAVIIQINTHFEGIILSKTNITLGKNSSINGRMLAQTAVTLIENSIVDPNDITNTTDCYIFIF